MRAFNSGISLTKEDASIVKGMLNRGDRQHDIASWFGVNGGRIAEISTGKKFKDVVTKNNNLPPVIDFLPVFKILIRHFCLNKVCSNSFPFLEKFLK